jgi:cellobiose phosphorylase
MNKRLSIFFIIILTTIQIIVAQNTTDKPLGNWGTDKFDMPYFSYTGTLPYKVNLKNGEKATIADDPYFLLGNYRFKMFVHVSGEYEIYSTERVISHFNKKENTQASIKIDGNNYRLTGINSVAADPLKTSRIFGAGYAEFTYNLPGIICKRVISVLPSEKINKGTSAFRITVSFKNSSDKNIDLNYNESLEALFEKIANSTEHNKLKYKLTFRKNNDGMAKGFTKIISDSDPFPVIARDDYSYNEYYPAVLFVSAEFNGNNKIIVTDNRFDGNYKTTLKPGKEATVNFIIGYSLTGSDDEINTIRKTLMSFDYTPDFASPVTVHPFTGQWSKRVDHFKNERDSDLRRELIWHNYVLEAIATHSDYFNETFIPQGCMYFFSWGMRAAPRDQLQHGLAACYTNPELAKSILRYVLKKSDTKGNIPFMDMGNGMVTSMFFQTSDQQLFFFMLLAEYLRITKDYNFLLEEVPCFPAKNNTRKTTVLNRLGGYFRNLKEEIGVGPHGLVRLRNSDWNDIVFYKLDTKYNAFFLSNESLMNTTMAASILPKLNRELQIAAKQPALEKDSVYFRKFTSSISEYRDKIWNAFLIDNGNRTFARRMYFNNKSVGDDNMFLEPQGFLMQVNDFSVEKKRVLYTEIQNRILNSETTGARQEEKPKLSNDDFGSRENGGIWYSLNGPLVIGLATWNKDAAWSLFHRLTLKYQSEKFPQYWSCYWSSFDSVDSSVLPSEGIHAQLEGWKYLNQKVTYCSHIHSWLIYSYKYLKELE